MKGPKVRILASKSGPINVAELSLLIEMFWKESSP